eukprot:jgi/Botrbrau1/18061/Bobra.0062s0047.1
MANIKRIETFNPERLRRIIDRSDHLFQHLDKKGSRRVRESAERYLRKSREGHISVTYGPSKNLPYGVGRVFAMGGIGLQPLEKRIRHTIAGEYYWDVDMVNAHPTILLQYCLKHGIPHANLSGYVNDRDAKLSSLMYAMGMDREDAKRYVLKFINSSGTVARISPSWFKELARELCQIRKRVCDLNEDVRPYADKSKNNEEGSLTNLVLCTMENGCLMKLVEFLESRNFKVGVLVFDGCMVEKGTDELTDDVLAEAQNYVLEKTGYDIPLLIKPMDQGFTEEELNDPPGGVQKIDERATLVLTSPVGDFSFAQVVASMGEGRFVRSDSGWWWWDEKTGRWGRDNIQVHLGRFISREVRAEYVRALRLYDEAPSPIKAEMAIPDEKALRSAPDLLLSKVKKDHIISECSKQDGMYEPKFEERFDADPYLMAFNNGLWDAHQMKFRPIEKNDYISYTTGYDYDPHVSTEEVRRIIRRMFEDDGTFISLIEVLAASMFGGNREEIFLILQGAGRNGKGLVLDLVIKTFGEDYIGSIRESYYTSHEKHSESGTPMLLDLRGKRLGITDETTDEAKFITRTMKRDTGGGMVKGRALYSNTVILTK